MPRRIISEKSKELIRNYPDEAYEIEMGGIEEGQKHVEPSEKTLSLIKSMEDKLDKLKDELLKKVGNIELTLEKTIREIFDKIDDKYARRDKVTLLANELSNCVRKEEVAKLNAELDDMRNKREERGYDWLKFGVTAIISGLLGVIITKFYK